MLDILILTIVFIQLPGAAEGCLAFSDRLVLHGGHFGNEAVNLNSSVLIISDC